MNTTAQFISYRQTGWFSRIVTDYISDTELLKPFYQHPVSVDGLKAAIADRKKYPTNRKLLVDELKKQYAGEILSAKQQSQNFWRVSSGQWVQNLLLQRGPPCTKWSNTLFVCFLALIYT